MRTDAESTDKWTRSSCINYNRAGDSNGRVNHLDNRLTRPNMHFACNTSVSYNIHLCTYKPYKGFNVLKLQFLPARRQLAQALAVVVRLSMSVCHKAMLLKRLNVL